MIWSHFPFLFSPTDEAKLPSMHHTHKKQISCEAMLWSIRPDLSEWFHPDWSWSGVISARGAFPIIVMYLVVCTWPVHGTCRTLVFPGVCMWSIYPVTSLSASVLDWLSSSSALLHIAPLLLTGSVMSMFFWWYQMVSAWSWAAVSLC